MLHLDSSHPILTCGSRLSRAPPHHTLPAFLYLNGKEKGKTVYNQTISLDLKNET